ncbi:uncharacterized protein N7503_011256 [Penicillium pulvis]|uniref:uncharacterized protein n=1 Tax=Penicillium pulvis TaxID=1562058 RepID=UPI0025487FAB|nr:uncharacterized protein N7503_011256 [Penicillium pulvis]KAJ5786044.1 hypothetical protein N7503_011256 [Penicillium pulvis]
MKSFLTLTALATLCSSAYCFSEGTYKIGSASLEKTKVLTEVPGQEDLVFNTANGHPGQIWDFTPTDEEEYFLVTNTLGAYIDCPALDSLCTAGEDPTSYRPELVADNTYELVANGTGYFLRLADDNKLKLAGYEPGLEQEFVLTKA